MRGTPPGSATRAGLALAVIAMVVSAGCAGRGGKLAGSNIPPGERFGVYRATSVDSAGESRRFRLWLFAARPDRIHAEVVHPVTGPRLIVDGGGGRLAVTVVGEKVAYAGEGETGPSLEGLGIEVSLEGLVSMLLSGEAPEGDGPWFRRDPSSGEGLPRVFEVEAGDGTLHLELQRYREVKAGGAGRLGTGDAGPGVEVRPLEELRDREDGDLLLGGEGTD